jgi:hypothetical protein
MATKREQKNSMPRLYATFDAFVLYYILAHYNFLLNQINEHLLKVRDLVRILGGNYCNANSLLI